MGKQTIMVCEFYFYSEQSRVSLETARIAYLPKKYHRYLNLLLQRRKMKENQIALVITKKRPSNLGLPILIVLLLILFFQVLSVRQLV